MKHQFTSSACGPAFYVPLSEIENVDLTFASVLKAGGNKKRMGRLDSNLDTLSDIFKFKHGISREDFHLGRVTLSLTKHRTIKGLGFER